MEIFQDGNKVVVRSELSGTQRGPFIGFPAKNRTMTIQTIDIHEFNDGKIIRTWHSKPPDQNTSLKLGETAARRSFCFRLTVQKDQMLWRTRNTLGTA